MSLLETIVLGFVQGITEFLPVSSSGHLALCKNVFGLSDIGITYDILLHFGTLVAVFIAFRESIGKLIINGLTMVGDICVNIAKAFYNVRVPKNGQKKEYNHVLSTPYKRFVMLVIISTIPAGIVGVLFKKQIELFGSTLIIPGICLLITGVLLLIADEYRNGAKDASNVTGFNALFVGIAQAFATLPGISRSGTTITAALVAGYEKSFAVEYSFIMSIPVILGSVVFDVKDIAAQSLSGEQILYYITGTVVAGIVGYICIKTMLKVVRNKKFRVFAYYCFAVGTLSIIAYAIK